MAPTRLVFLLLSRFVVVFPAASADQTLEAEEGDDVLLQCLLDPRVDVSGSTVEWSKDGRGNIVHLYINGRDRAGDQRTEFKDRTLLFHRGLNSGNVTLQLVNVTRWDSGTYRCHVVRLKTFCYTVLSVVTKGRLNRSQRSYSTTTRPSPDDELNNPDGGNRNLVCVDVLMTVSGIFCIVLLVVIVMILGIIWVYRKVHGGTGRQTRGQNLRVDGGEVGRAA